MPKLQTLLGDGCAVVVGLPENFNLSGALQSATEIRLATAFAHRTGWNFLEREITANPKGKVFLLTGLGYNQTEPKVLRRWLKLQSDGKHNVIAKLASHSPFFHPKVLIIHARKNQFAIVGSGNLSKGGLKTNCECGVFVGDAPTVATLCEWFDEQFAAAKELNGEKIEAYEPDYYEAKKKAAELAKLQKSTEKKINAVRVASMADWNRALELAEAFFHDRDFKTKYMERLRSSKQMLGLLKPPKFEFDKNGWDEFYKKRVLGKLNPIPKDRVFKAGPRLRNALRLLIQDPQATIPAVLGTKGKLRISGFAENTVSKILAAKYHSEWFVYNKRAATVLADFGYKALRGAGRDGRYIAFCHLMQKFMAACKERGLSNVDAISLDAFVVHRSEELKRKQEVKP